VAVPGVKHGKTWNVSSKEGRLEVTASTKPGEKSRRFRVAFTRPTDVDEANLEASLERGVLALALPKTANPEAPREILVKFAKP